MNTLKTAVRLYARHSPRSLAGLSPFGAFISAVLFLTLLPALARPVLADEARLDIPIAQGAGGAPEGWRVKEWKGRAEFNVVDTDGGKAVHMKSKGTSSALYKDISLDIRDYPVLNWRWKVTEVPKGADVRKKSTDDQAAQVYVVFPRWPATINSRAIGYIWDTSAPEGAVIQSTKTSNTWYVVLKSGNKGIGEWHRESRDVYADYKKIFSEEPPKVGNVSVMIDSDDTKGSAESFVADIFFSKKAAGAK